MSELHTHRFYRIDGRILFCLRYTWTAHKPGGETIDFEGIAPEDYAVYVAHKYIGEHKEPYRTIADIECIPFPDVVKIHCSADAKIEEMSNEEAFREWKSSKEQAK